MEISAGRWKFTIDGIETLEVTAGAEDPEATEAAAEVGIREPPAVQLPAAGAAVPDIFR